MTVVSGYGSRSSLHYTYNMDSVNCCCISQRFSVLGSSGCPLRSFSVALSPLELFAGYLAADQLGEAQDRIVEPGADGRADCFLCGRGERLDPNLFVSCRHARMPLAKPDFRHR